MKRARLTNYLRQRRLLRKLSRQSPRRAGAIEWIYRDHHCIVNFDALSGVFIGVISNTAQMPVLSADNLDELQKAFYRAVDSYMDVNVPDEKVTITDSET